MLFQQWLVDAWLTHDLHNMEYYRFNQDTLRADKYSTLAQAFAEGVPPDQVGTRFILPSEVKGSIRYMKEKYQDSMALVRYYGKPCLFITFTCNPNW
jgi:hypothetical protein